MSAAEIPRYIVIEGPIGVGKTSLAKRLAEEFGGELLLEGAEENPFLERFYRNPRHAALPTQLFFLFQRAQQIQDLRQSDMFAPVRVADFILEKDRLFAELTLDDHELRLYNQVYDNITVDAPQPDLVIYLQAPVDVLLTRVQKRGRDFERFIETNYLERLVEAYTRFFYHYSATPLLIVNAADIDLVNNDQDYQLLLDRLRKTTSGRHYFNPGSFDL
ncbi:deoxynucleoside kinase [Beggiatoa alba]|nr:deoxynucleoside kinase [Beggiatoa alba]